MAKKTPVMVSEKGTWHKLEGGPHDGLKIRLGHGLPHQKGTPSKRVPLPLRIPFRGGAYILDGGEYRWMRD